MGKGTIHNGPVFDPPTLRVFRGTYVLILQTMTARRLSIGKLGRFTFPTGWYAYAGSARGPGGLAARLGHHLHIASRPHWHIDYLRSRAFILETWYGRARDHDEHRWAACLSAMSGGGPVVTGFGSSDCRCPTHLFFFSARPNVAQFRRKLRSLSAKRVAPVYRIALESPSVEEPHHDMQGR